MKFAVAPESAASMRVSVATGVPTTATGSRFEKLTPARRFTILEKYGSFAEVTGAGRMTDAWRFTLRIGSSRTGVWLDA